MPAPDVVEQLVERFAGDTAGYTSPNYNETEARLEFIDPLFRALGWDVGNTQGAPPDLRDVIYEQTFKRTPGLKQPEEIIGKRPDYTFRVEQRPRFYVEAKKPAEDVRHNPKYAFQVRSYGWSTKLPISVLTDFQELAVYDCRVPPRK